MPFDRPDLPALLERVLADIEGRLPEADSRLRRSALGVLARAHAGAVHGLYGHLDWTADQVLPDTAEAEWLERHASIWGLTRKPAVAAGGDVTFTGEDGAVIPTGTLLRRGDGAEYTTDAEATIAGGTATAAATAKTPGAAGNADAGTKLSLPSPIAGVQSGATVAAGGLTGGTDAEGDASLLSRLLQRIQEPPHGGAAHDYVAWALQVPEVTRAWCYPGELGIGTVTVRFMTDDATADGIPTPEKVAEVQAYIDQLRPVTAELFVVAPVAVPLTVTIAGLSPNTADVRAAVEAELADLVRRAAEPGGTILVSHIREAISIAAGEHDHRLVGPTEDVTHATGEIATWGGVTWQ